MHSTNYFDTFITIAADSAAVAGIRPPDKATPTVAALTWQLIGEHPYELTSDDVLFEVHAQRAGIPESDREAARAEFFGTGRACLRASPLTKTYGWGVHCDVEGRVALYGVETGDYADLAAGQGSGGEPLRVISAMRSRR